MIGLIVTGHGHFATGLTSSLNLIAGEQQDYVAVDFDGEGTEKITKDLQNALDKLKSCEGIIVFSDLLGGCPFKTAVTLSQGMNNVKVIAGTNLSMLCEIALSRTMVNDLDALVSSALSVGKDGVQVFETVEVNNGPKEDEAGI